MKNIFLALTVFSSLSIAAETPVVSKSTGGGHVPSQYQRSETCKVFRNRVEITHYYGYASQGGAVLTEKRAISLQADVNAILAAAAKEELQEGNPGPCDIPTTSITAGEKTELFFTGACGSKRQERVGTASRMLTEIVNLYCPKTIDFSKPN